MKRLYLCSFVFLFLFVAAGCGRMGSSDLVMVNDKAITLEDYNKALEAIPSQFKEEASSHKRDILNNMVIDELMYQEAVKLGAYRDPDVKQLIQNSRKRILITWLLDKHVYSDIDISDEALRKYYDRRISDFVQPETVKASHILVDREKEAEDIKRRIGEGADFSELAKEYSKGPSAAKGGDVGYFARGQMVKEFEDAAFALKVGEVSDIVKTRFGYHIIKLTDRRPRRQVSFEEAKDRVRLLYTQDSRKRLFDEYTRALQEKAEVSFNKKLLEKNAIKNSAANKDKR